MYGIPFTPTIFVQYLIFKQFVRFYHFLSKRQFLQLPVRTYKITSQATKKFCSQSKKNMNI